MKSTVLIMLSVIWLLSCQSDLANEQETASKSANLQAQSGAASESASLIINEKKEGDIIFQTSLSSQSLAIQKATHSKYSHMGILFKYEEQWFVFEAIQPVSITPFEKWIDRGAEDHFIIKRLNQFPEGLSDSQINRLKEVAQQFQGKDYDSHFAWSDEQIYCSELVWKIYEEGLDISLCDLKELREFDLSAEVVKQKLGERYGNKIPMLEKVVSPEDIFQSKLLVEINLD